MHANSHKNNRVAETFPKPSLRSTVMIMSTLIHRDAYFTTIAANKGRQEWLDCIEKSIKKYCQATESQIQEYLMGKYESFLTNADQNSNPVKIAPNAVGLQSIVEDDV